MLYRAAVELVEDALDLVAHRARPEKPATFSDAVLQIAVAPVRVHTDCQRAVGELGERRVVVPSKGRERASRGLYEDHAFPTAPRGGDLGSSADGINGDLGERAIAACRAEEDIARTAFTRGRVERHLPRGHAQRLHHGIRLDEATAEEGTQPEERATAVFRRHRVHEVLHRVGGDDLPIVAFAVRREEALSEDIYVD